MERVINKLKNCGNTGWNSTTNRRCVSDAQIYNMQVRKKLPHTLASRGTQKQIDRPYSPAITLVPGQSPIVEAIVFGLRQVTRLARRANNPMIPFEFGARGITGASSAASMAR